MKAIIEENKVVTNYADDFYEADDIYGFVKDELAELNDLDVDAADMEIMETFLDDIPNAQPQSNSPPTNESISSSTNESTTPTGGENNTIPASAVALTPTNPIQQHLDQHTLMKQVTILNNCIALLRANQAANPQAIQTLPLENVFNNVSNVLPQTTTTTTTTSSSNKENTSQATTTAKTTVSRRGPKPLPRDPGTGKIIRPLKPDGTEIVKHRKSKKQNSENNQ